MRLLCWEEKPGLEAFPYNINMAKAVVNSLLKPDITRAAFIDTGRVFGQSELSKNQTTWMTSVGVGARLYSTHSSEARVIHIDIIKPLSSDENVNSIEFRVTTKHSF